MFRGQARGRAPGTAHLYRIRHSMEVARGTVRGRRERKNEKPGMRRAFRWSGTAMDQSNLYVNCAEISRPIGL